MGGHCEPFLLWTKILYLRKEFCIVSNVHVLWGGRLLASQFFVTFRIE